MPKQFNEEKKVISTNDWNSITWYPYGQILGLILFDTMNKSNYRSKCQT